LLIGFALVAGAITVAPWLPQTSSKRRSDQAGQASQASGAISESRGFIYRTDPETFDLALDPRLVRFDLFEGWDRENEAFSDRGALAYLSGPMYERHVGEDGSEITVPLGDLKLGDRVWRGDNRTASRQRAFIGIRHDGSVEFGFGELTPEREKQFDTFIGGLHSLYNDTQTPPASYRGAYSISMGQQIRYFLPRIRIVIGLLPDGRLEALMSRDGLTLEQTKDLARRHGMVAAYLPDHASKSRFIIPGHKGFSEEDANWISGGATSFVHVPYMLRLSQRNLPLQGSLLGVVSRHLPHQGCGSLATCFSQWGGAVLDHGLAGVNRLMDQVVDPLARLVWAPRSGRPLKPPIQGAPMREPVITADPQPVQQRQHTELQAAPEAPVTPPGDGNGDGNGSSSRWQPQPEAPQAAPAEPSPKDNSPAQPQNAKPEASPAAPTARDRSGQDRSGQDRSGQDRSGQDRPSSERSQSGPGNTGAGDPPAPVLPAPATPAPRVEPPAAEARRSVAGTALRSERREPPPLPVLPLPPLPPPPLPPLPTAAGAAASPP
jgi:pyruvate/2-oxoglutarate dehydrogenase complex dihydrolipoamide acyltransferase (E2) component